MKQIWSVIAYLLLVHFAQAQDSIRVGVPYPLGFVNPVALEDPLNRIILNNVSSGSVRLVGNQLNLELLDSVTAGSDFKTWTVFPKENIQLPSGSRVSSETLKASFSFLQKFARSQTIGANINVNAYDRLVEGVTPNLAQHLARTLPPALLDKLTSITKMETVVATDEATGTRRSGLLFTLTNQQATFDKWVLSVPVIDAEAAELFGKDFGQGTNFPSYGPYQIRENRPASTLTLTATPGYFRPTYPRTPQIEFKYFDSAATALSALRTASIDMILLPTQSQLDEIANDTVIQTSPSPLLIMLHNPKITGGWKPYKTFWSHPGDQRDALLTNVILHRKSLLFDAAFKNYFDFSGTTHATIY